MLLQLHLDFAGFHHKKVDLKLVFALSAAHHQKKRLKLFYSIYN